MACHVVIAPLRPGYTAENAHTPSVMKHIDMFHCVTDDFILRPQADDAVDAYWVPPDDLGGILTWPQELDFFARHRPQIGV